MKNWQGMPTTRLTLSGEVMVRRDNSTLAFSTELLNYIIAFATQGKNGHHRIFDHWHFEITIRQYEPTVFLFMNSDSACIIGFFTPRMKILYNQKQKVNRYVPTPCISSKRIQKRGFVCAGL